MERVDGREECIPPIKRNFVRPGGAKAKTIRRQKSILEGAAEWVLEVDYDTNHYVFPPEIYSTNERPDILIWSKLLKRVIIIELTCPAEEGILAAQATKEARYHKDLIPGILGPQEWTPTLFTIEVGARGFVAKSTRYCLSRLGISRKEKTKLVNTLSKVAAKCSYTILQSSTNTTWEDGRPLLRLELN